MPVNKPCNFVSINYNNLITYKVDLTYQTCGNLTLGKGIGALDVYSELEGGAREKQDTRNRPP